MLAAPEVIGIRFQWPFHGVSSRPAASSAPGCPPASAYSPATIGSAVEPDATSTFSAPSDPLTTAGAVRYARATPGGTDTDELRSFGSPASTVSAKLAVSVVAEAGAMMSRAAEPPSA